MLLVNSLLISFAAATHLSTCGSPYPEVTDVFIAEFLNDKLPVRLGLLDHPTGVGLRYGFVKLSRATVFLEAERDRLARLAASIWDMRSTHPRDLPPGINALRIPRPVI